MSEVPEKKNSYDPRKGDKSYPAHGETNGGKSTLTLELIDQICGIAGLGTSEKSTAALVGINRHTFRFWLTQGVKDPDSIHGVLLKKLQESIAATETRVLKTVSDFLYGRPAVYQEVTNTTITTKPDGTVIREEEKRLVCVQPAIEPSEKMIQWFLRNRFGDNWGDIIGLNQNKEEFTPLVVGQDQTSESIEKINKDIANIASQISKITGGIDE